MEAAPAPSRVKPQPQQQLAQLVPPVMFGLVERGIYRTNALIPANLPFIKQLQLKTVVRYIFSNKRANKGHDPHVRYQIIPRSPDASGDEIFRREQHCFCKYFFAPYKFATPQNSNLAISTSCFLWIVLKAWSYVFMHRFIWA